MLTIMIMILLKIWEYLKDHWKCIAIGVSASIALIAIIFALPLVTKSTETTEMEYVTEFRLESYVVDEPYVTTETVEKTEIIASRFYTVVPVGVFVPFYVDKPDTRLVGYFQNTIPGRFTVLTDTNRVFWETYGSMSSINLTLPSGAYQARFREDIMWAEDCFIHLEKKWTEVEQVTKYREVVRYHYVPVNVEKQKVIIEEGKISVWEHLFG